jgi:hypothetical protein
LRTISEIQVLLKATAEIQFFQTYINKNQSHIHLECCKKMSHLSLEAGEKVFSIGKQILKKKIIEKAYNY